MGECENGWVDCMDMEPDLLQSDIRSRGFLPATPATPSSASSTWSVQHSAYNSEKLILSQENPFGGLRIADTSPLNLQEEREACPVCSKSRKFFCYTCHVPVASLSSAVPRLRLPVQVDIVKHAREVEGKSTAIHARIIAPEDVNILIYPDIPDYRLEKALLVFPGKESRTLVQICEDAALAAAAGDNSSPAGAAAGDNSSPAGAAAGDNSVPDQLHPPFPYDKIVFIDSTWNQCKRIYNDERIHDLPSVVLSSRNTVFWRYQKGKPRHYLATIEAVYYFLLDYHTLVLQRPYQGEYDNILFFFKFMYQKIHQLYDPTKLRAYTWD